MQGKQKGKGEKELQEEREGLARVPRCPWPCRGHAEGVGSSATNPGYLRQPWCCMHRSLSPVPPSPHRAPHRVPPLPSRGTGTPGMGPDPRMWHRLGGRQGWGPWGCSRNQPQGGNCLCPSAGSAKALTPGGEGRRAKAVGKPEPDRRGHGAGRKPESAFLLLLVFKAAVCFLWSRRPGEDASALHIKHKQAS